MTYKDSGDSIIIRPQHRTQMLRKVLHHSLPHLRVPRQQQPVHLRLIQPHRSPPEPPDQSILEYCQCDTLHHRAAKVLREQDQRDAQRDLTWVAFEHGLRGEEGHLRCGAASQALEDLE